MTLVSRPFVRTSVSVVTAIADLEEVCSKCYSLREKSSCGYIHL